VQGARLLAPRSVRLLWWLLLWLRSRAAALSVRCLLDKQGGQPHAAPALLLRRCCRWTTCTSQASASQMARSKTCCWRATTTARSPCLWVRTTPASCPLAATCSAWPSAWRATTTTAWCVRGWCLVARLWGVTGLLACRQLAARQLGTLLSSHDMPLSPTPFMNAGPKRHLPGQRGLAGGNSQGAVPRPGRGAGPWRRRHQARCGPRDILALGPHHVAWVRCVR
jgi:hypothetical protein